MKIKVEYNFKHNIQEHSMFMRSHPFLPQREGFLGDKVNILFPIIITFLLCLVHVLTYVNTSTRRFTVHCCDETLVASEPLTVKMVRI